MDSFDIGFSIFFPFFFYFFFWFACPRHTLERIESLGNGSRREGLNLKGWVFQRWAVTEAYAFAIQAFREHIRRRGGSIHSMNERCLGNNHCHIILNHELRTAK